MTTFTSSYEQEMRTQSEALIDLAGILEEKIPASITTRLAKALPGVILQEIKGGLQLREQALVRHERDYRHYCATKIANQKKRAMMEQIIVQLPTGWNCVIHVDSYDVSFIEGDQVSLTLKNTYSSTWSTNPTGVKLRVSVDHEHRNFPLKKDGTFSIDKVVTYIQGEKEARAIKQSVDGEELAKLKRFNSLLKPYVRYGIYKIEETLEISEHENMNIKRAWGKEEKYLVTRSVTQEVTAEQLKQILATEATPVVREQVEA